MITKQDLRNIEKHLQLNSIQLPQLPQSFKVLPTDFLVLITQDNSKLISVKELIKLISLSTSQLIINSEQMGIKGNEIEEIVKNIPVHLRVLGQLLTFKNSRDKWELYQFEGETLLSYTDEELWTKIK